MKEALLAVFIQVSFLRYMNREQITLNAILHMEVSTFGSGMHYMVSGWWKLYRRMLTAMTSICRMNVQTKA
jgi:hypothetical protein